MCYQVCTYKTMSPVLKNPCDPSQDSDHNNLFSFLSNKDCMKLYNKCHAKVWFLQPCREQKLIPKTLRISNLINLQMKI